MAFRKISVLLTLTVCGTLATSAQNPGTRRVRSEGYFICGTINGIELGTVRMFAGNGNSVLDSARIVKGRFFMQGKIGSPQRMLFTASPGSWSFRAFVEDTAIVLHIDTTGAEHYGKGNHQWALIWDIEEKGSKLADVYTRYKNEAHTSVLLSLRKKLKAVEGKADQESRLKRKMDSLYGLITTRQKRWIENYINRYPSAIAGLYLFYEYYQSSPDTSLSYLDSILNRFAGPATSSVYYKELTGIAVNLRSTQPDSLAPDFTLLQRDRSPFTLSSARGNYILIDFWASWCLPCREAIPVWKEVYAKYKHKGFMMVGLSGDRKWNAWISALDREQMPWVQVIDTFPNNNEPALTAELFRCRRLPFYVLLNKEGKVMLASGEKERIRKKIEELFD